MDKKIKLETIITSLTLLKENKGFVNGIILDYIFNIHRQPARVIESKMDKNVRVLTNFVDHNPELLFVDLYVINGPQLIIRTFQIANE
jgi:hypothetical protein